MMMESSTSNMASSPPPLCAPRRNRRRSSMGVGYVYCKQQHTHANKSQDQAEYSYHNNQEQRRRRSYPVPKQRKSVNKDCCTCNASRLEEELECLRESTKNALHQSWDEVELLNKKCASHDELIASLKLQLQESLKREQELEHKWSESLKELKKVSSINGYGQDEVQENSNDQNGKILRRPSLSSIFDWKTQLLSRKNPRGSFSYTDNQNQTTSTDNNRTYHHSADQSSLSREESKHPSSVALAMMSVEDTPDDNVINNDYGPSSTSTLDVVDNLRVKLEVRDQEISVLESAIVENMKTFQELHLQLEGQKEEEDKEEDKESS